MRVCKICITILNKNLDIYQLSSFAVLECVLSSWLCEFGVACGSYFFLSYQYYVTCVQKQILEKKGAGQLQEEELSEHPQQSDTDSDYVSGGLVQTLTAHGVCTRLVSVEIGTDSKMKISGLVGASPDFMEDICETLPHTHTEPRHLRKKKYVTCCAMKSGPFTF